MNGKQSELSTKDQQPSSIPEIMDSVQKARRAEDSEDEDDEISF